jgi:hypothetical protein
VLTHPNPVTAADVNGDGKLDLICANGGSSTLTVLTNNGSGRFVLAGTCPVGHIPDSVTAADVNGDGKVDLISANIDDTLTVLTNNGSGGFVLANTYPVGHIPTSVVAADVNGDGKVDLITANCGGGSGNTLTVLTNNGSGGFVFSSTLIVGNGPNSVAAADVNGDGKVDLITANWGSSGAGNTLTVLTNNGSGGFVFSSTLNVGKGPFYVAAADVNGDGKLDLISANNTDGTLTILTNNGSGRFVLATTLIVGLAPDCVAAADVNGDGKLDLISANSGNGTLSVFTNATPFPPFAPPTITTQPIGITNLVGATATFTVGANSGSTGWPLGYQWRWNGTNLPAATNNPLILTNLTLSQAGNYDVVIADSAGSITSCPAILDVRFILVTVNGQPAAGTMAALVSATVTLSGGYPGGFLFYTLDGSTPSTSSTLYNGPITLTNSAVVQVMGLSSDFTQASYAAPVNVQIIPVYNLQTSVVGGGSINTNPASGTYASNSIVTLTATAAQYWAFDHWTGDATGSQNPLSLTMNGPLNVQAVFVQTAYPLTVSSPGGGGITANGQVISPATYYSTGSVVTLSAGANSGWSFLNWQGDAAGTNNPLNVTINGTNNIQATFGTAVGTNAVGGGIVLSQPNPIPFGKIVTASAIPNAGNYFVTWSGAASGTNAPTTLLVTNANPTINALFSTLPGGKYSLAVVVFGNGSVAISPQQNSYNPGDNVTLTASTTNVGTSFFGWTGDVSGTNNSIVVVMDTSKVVQANFGVFPVVNVSPQNLIVFAGSNAVLNANAAGLPPLAYQWQNSQGAIAGQTNATFAIIDAQVTNSDNYAVVVSNPLGSITSAVATVTVVLPPSISSQPIPQAVAVGASLVLGASADGTAPLSYQWQNSSGAIPGQTNSSLDLSPAQTNYSDNYSVVVSNPYASATSQVASVFVYLPVSILAQPNSLVGPASASASFSVVASGFPAPTSYQWTFNGTNLPGATSSLLNINRINLSTIGNYQVLVGNGYSFTNSTIATLNMSPSITSPFNGATTIWGQSAALSVGAIGSGGRLCENSFIG